MALTRTTSTWPVTHPTPSSSGAAGEGEQDLPRELYAAELFELLLERGSGTVRHPGPLQDPRTSAVDRVLWLTLV